MAIPEFIVALREKIGTAPLWLSGVCAVVVRPTSRGSQLLLVKADEHGPWAPVTGIIDPGEEPADAAIREVAEEVGVEAVAQRLALVCTSGPLVYPNGDQGEYLTLVFRMEWVGGEPYPADGENVAAAWFDLDALPDVRPMARPWIEAALAQETATRFMVGGQLQRP